MDDKGVEADWAVWIVSSQRLLFYRFPKVAELLSMLLLLVHGKGALFLLVHRSLDIGEKRLQQLLSALDVFVD